MNDEIIKKLEKILNLAARGGTEEEAKAAMARATEIAMRYKINLADVEIGKEASTKSKVGEFSGIKTRSKYRQPYHVPIANLLKACFGVHFIFHIDREVNGIKVTKITMLGDEADVTLCQILWTWLEELFPKTLSTAVKNKILTYSMADTNGCYEGLVTGLIEANKKAEESMGAENANKYAIAKRSNKKEIDELKELLFGNKLKDARARELLTSTKGLQHGASVGRSINLSQMNGNRAQQRIG